MTRRGRPPGVKNGEGKAARLREPQRPLQTMFTLPRIDGAELFDELVMAYGGPERVARDLKLSPDLVARWRRADPEPPYTMLLALWWQSPHGFNQAFSECHWTHLHNFNLRRQAEERNTLLEQTLQRVADVLGWDHPALNLAAPMLAIANR